MARKGAIARWFLAAATAAFSALTWAAPAGAQTPGLPPVPIPQNPLFSTPGFEGATAVPRPIRGVKPPPRHPFMAANERSNLHDDAYQTDAYEVSGPLGNGAKTSNFFVRECGSVTFDQQGRIVTVCVGLDRPVLALLDPNTLNVLAALPLAPRNLASGSNPFTDFSGGGYFYLDHRDRAVVSTNDRHVVVVGINAGPSFAVARDYNLSGKVASGDGIVSVLPDWSGRLWFVTRRGIVGTVDRDSGEVRTIKLEGEGISNSFAVDDSGGVFIVSDAALYRFDAGKGGEPAVSWRQPYPDSGVHKPGQSDAGSGTTPTLTQQGWVAITDNADPMNIRVYRRAQRIIPTKKKRRAALRKAGTPQARLRLKIRWRSRRREVCSEPVFGKGAGSTDQSLIVAGNSIITENNYGYSGVTATQFGGTTLPGLARVDVVAKKAKRTKRGRPAAPDAKRRSHRSAKRPKRFVCREVWTSSERAPSVVPKVSLGNGLVYTYTKPPNAAGDDPWYLTALDFRSGATVYRRFSGEGLGYNNNFAPVTLGPDGTAYVGVLGGLVRFSK
jgi:hypothetical protein